MVTVGIAVGGFRTFDRWKREKIEEKRIDAALDALAYAYESKFVFDSIRAAMAYPYEWEKMPELPGDTEQKRAQRGSFFAIFRRIEATKDFFDRGWKLQIRCAAIFGPEMETAFRLVQEARHEISVAAEMLYRDPYPTNDTQDNRDTWDTFRATVWPAYGRLAKEGDTVGKKLEQFRSQVETACRPVIDRQLGRPSPAA